MRATKEEVRQKIIAARDLIKCHPLTPELAMELFTSKCMGVFRFSATLIEWSESELNDVKRLCVQAYKNAWHLPRSTATALFIFPKTHAGKESTLPMAVLTQELLLHWKAVKTIKTQADIRHAFSDPEHGSRVRLSAASLTNPFQAPILWQEVDHDPMPMDAYDGSSEQSRCDIVATNSSALLPRDLLPLQLKVNLPLQQVELDQMQTDERNQYSEELSVDKDTLRPRARALSPWHSTLVPRHESNTRASGLRHDVFNRIGPLKLDHQAISPGSSALRSRNTPNPRKGVSRTRPSNGDPSIRYCIGISRLALKPRRSVLRSLQRVSSLQAGSFRADNIGYSGGMSEASVAPAAAFDHFNPRTDLAPVITVVVVSTASNASSIAFAACCSGVGAGGETGSGEDGSGDCVMDTSDSGAGGSASGITHTRGTGNSGYSGGVSGASVTPAAAVDHFNPRTDLAPVITVVAASTASNVSSVAFAASTGANDNESGWDDFEKPLDMLPEEELETWKEKKE